MQKTYIKKSKKDEMKYIQYNIKNWKVQKVENIQKAEKIRKVVYCSEYFKNKKCLEKCVKAHTKEELNIKILEDYRFDSNFFMFHYRTELCPLIEFKHQRYNCIYAHNKGELRRCFHLNLKSKVCDKIKRKKRCKEQEKCQFLHNNNEYYFHPLIYKKNKCRELICINKNTCYNYHDNAEVRNQKVENLNFFYFFPYNKFQYKLSSKFVVDSVKSSKDSESN